MNKKNENFDKEDYKYLASGHFKDVFLRKSGFQPPTKSGGVDYPKNKRYVSVFLSSSDMTTELNGLFYMQLVDPLGIFTLPLLGFRDLKEDPHSVSLMEHLISQVPAEWRKHDAYAFEILFLEGGISYDAELSKEMDFSLSDFLFQILFLIFCMGYMNDSGYYHMDIKDANILFSNSQLFLIDFSQVTRDCKVCLSFPLYFDEKEFDPNQPLNLVENIPPEANYLIMLDEIDISKNSTQQSAKYKKIKLTLKDWLEWVKKFSPEIVKEHIFYLKELKKLQRFSPERFEIDREYKDYLVETMKLRDKISLQRYGKLKGLIEKNALDNTVSTSSTPAKDKIRKILLLYADKHESYQLGSTILVWIRTFREKFYRNLNKKDKHIFDSFSLNIYEHLCAFNVIFRMDLTSFHKHFLKQLRFFGCKDLLQEYKAYCTKIYKEKNETAESNPHNEAAMKSERQHVENLFSYLDLLIY